MALLLSLSERSFAPQTRNFSLSVDPQITEFRVTLQHPDWPEGECVRCNVDWDGDAPSGTVSLGGGVVRDKAGNPTGGTMTTVWSCRKPAGVSGGTCNLRIMQTLTSAVLIEGF